MLKRQPSILRDATSRPIWSRLFRKDGVFYIMPTTDLKPLKELFRAGVLSMLKAEGLIDDAVCQKIMKWRHISGFSAYNGMQIRRDYEKGFEGMSKVVTVDEFFFATTY